MLTIPMVQFDATLGVERFTTAEITLPSLQLQAYGGGHGAVTFPSLTISATITSNPVYSVDVTLPRLQLAANINSQGKITLAGILPALQLSASGYQAELIKVNLSLPALLVSSTIINGDGITFSNNLPTLKIRSALNSAPLITAAITLPSLQLYSRISQTAVGLCLNTRNFALTRYDSYNYNSLFYSNGKLLGLQPTGIYELTGDTDNGTFISWLFQIGLVDFESHSPRTAVVTGKVSEDMKIAVETPDGSRWEYDSEPVASTEDEIRTKIGKGIKSRYLIFEVNGSESRITLDQFKVFANKGGKER